MDKQPKSLSTHFVQVQDCHGDQGDLEIFLGLKNEIITNAVQQGGHHGAGLAVRSDFDHAKYRNGGYLWIDHFSNDRSKLKQMLLHELGHIFGMKHNSVAVMDEKIADWLFNPNYQSQFLGSIETSFWKYRIDNGDSLQFFTAPTSNPRSSDGSGMVSSSTVPHSLMQNLGLQPGQKFKAKINFLRFASPLSLYYFQLQLDLPDQAPPKFFTLQLQATRNQNWKLWAQGIYTQWIDSLGTAKFDEQLIDLNLLPRDFIGSVSIGAQNLAATLNTETGVTLRIFEPTFATWWELK